MVLHTFTLKEKLGITAGGTSHHEGLLGGNKGPLFRLKF